MILEESLNSSVQSRSWSQTGPFTLQKNLLPISLPKLKARPNYQQATRQDAVSHIVVCNIISIMRTLEEILTTFQKHNRSCHLGLVLWLSSGCLPQFSEGSYFLLACGVFQSKSLLDGIWTFIKSIFNLLVTVFGLAFQGWWQCNTFLGRGKRKKRRWMGMRRELGPKKVWKVRTGYFTFFYFVSTSFCFCKRFQSLMDLEGEKNFLSNFLSAFFYFFAKCTHFILNMDAIGHV